MPTIIDELIVTLGLDTSQFTKEQRKAAAAFLQSKGQVEQQAKLLEGVGKKMLESISVIQTRVASVFALFLGGKGVKEFVSQWATVGAETARTSRQLNESVRDLSTWRGAVEAAGGDAAGLTQSFSNLVGEIQRFALTGESSVVPWFRTLGVDLADGSGKARKIGDILLDLADKTHKLNDPAKASTILQAIGLDSGTINLLLKGRDAVQGYLDKQSKLALSDTDAANAEKTAAAWVAMEQSAKRLGNTIVTVLSPAFTWLLDKATTLINLFNNSTDENKKTVTTWASSLQKYGLFPEGVKWQDGTTTASGGKPTTASTPTSGLPSEARALLDTIAGPESGGRYNALYGVNKSFSDYSRHPNVSSPITTGPNAGKTTTAAGKYQFLTGTWNEAQKALSLPDFSPDSQDQAAWWLAQRDYKKRTGRDLLEDLKDPGKRGGVGSSLAGTWTSLPGGIEAGSTNGSFARALDAASRRASPNVVNPLNGAFAGSAPSGNAGTKNETAIGQIIIHTDKLTAAGIANEIGPAISAQSLAAQAQTGQQ